jgi:hypothetical protein
MSPIQRAQGHPGHSSDPGGVPSGAKFQPFPPRRASHAPDLRGSRTQRVWFLVRAPQTTMLFLHRFQPLAVMTMSIQPSISTGDSARGIRGPNLAGDCGNSMELHGRAGQRRSGLDSKEGLFQAEGGDVGRTRRIWFGRGASRSLCFSECWTW